VKYLPRVGIVAALLVSALSCSGCQGEEAQKAANLEKVQAKLQRGREEAAKITAKQATSSNPFNKTKKGGR
jgi:hypothetical protein